MGTKTKVTLAASFVGVVAMAAAAFGQSSTPTPSTSASPRAERRADRGGECGPKHVTRRGARVVHGDMKVRVPDGFALVTVDNGKVTAVDHDAKKITVERADGESVTATATDETKVCKDGAKSSFDAIKVGDLAHLVQVRSERINGLRRIMVLTPGSDQAPPERPARRAPGSSARPGGVTPTDTSSDVGLDEAF